MYATAPLPSPIDWALAERVAHRVAGREPLERPYHARLLERDFEQVTAEAEELGVEYNGLHPAAGRASALVLDRPAWASANIRSFQHLHGPLADRLAERMARKGSPPGAAALTRKVAGLEMGALVGFMAQRVLGQYDLLVPDGPS